MATGGRSLKIETGAEVASDEVLLRGAGVKKRSLGFLPVAAVIALLSFWKVGDPDAFWHLKTGELILESGRLIRTNQFSAIFSQHPWPNPEWLFQVLLAACYKAGGWPGVQIFRVVLVLLLGAVLYGSVIAATRRWSIAAALTLIAVAAMRFRFNERPQLFSLLFFGVTVLVVDRFLRRGGRVLWFLPPLFALWSNFHPEFVLGLGYMGLVAAGEALNGVGRGRTDWRVPSRLVAFLGLNLVATLLNPEGGHALSFPLLHLFLGPVVAVSEYRATALVDAPVFWCALLAWSTLLFFPRSRRDWRELLPAFGAGLLGVLYLRDFAYFFIVTAIPVGRRCAALAPRRVVAAGCLLAVVASLTWTVWFDRLIPYRWGWGINDQIVPVAAANALLAQSWQGNLVNNYGDGGYLIYALYPRYGVFQDGRVQAYPREFLSRLNVNFNEEDWPRIVNDYRLELALMENRQARFEIFSRKTWGMVYWDDRWCLLVRRGLANAELLGRLEYRLFLPGAAFMGTLDPAELEVLSLEMSRNQRERLAPSAQISTARGVIAYRLGRVGEAESLFREALRIDPQLTVARENLDGLIAESRHE